MNHSTPAAASAAGELLWIEHPFGGPRPMAHVFMLPDDGGIAYADHGWSDGLSGRHPFHYILGAVQQAGANRWQLMPTQAHMVNKSGGEPIVIRLPETERETGTPDGDREHARQEVALQLSLDNLTLARD